MSASPLPGSAREDFNLSGEPETPALELEPLQADRSATAPLQTELFLPADNPEQPETTPQIEFDGMAPPRLAVQLDDGRQLHFQHARTLLESLEAQRVDVHYQCREGYCGSCRVQLLEGSVYYLEEPMAWINEDEILPCCCIPRSDIKLKL